MNKNKNKLMLSGKLFLRFVALFFMVINTSAASENQFYQSIEFLVIDLVKYKPPQDDTKIYRKGNPNITVEQLKQMGIENHPARLTFRISLGEVKKFNVILNEGWIHTGYWKEGHEPENLEMFSKLKGRIKLKLVNVTRLDRTVFQFEKVEILKK